MFSIITEVTEKWFVPLNLIYLNATIGFMQWIFTLHIKQNKKQYLTLTVYVSSASFFAIREEEEGKKGEEKEERKKKKGRGTRRREQEKRESSR